MSVSELITPLSFVASDADLNNSLMSLLSRKATMSYLLQCSYLD